MKLRLIVIAALGLALTLYLVNYVGLGAVLTAAGTVGWGGFAILCLYALALLLLLGASWYVLLPASPAARLRVFIWARMVRDATADLLPFSQLGGMVLGARAAILHGVSRPLAFASLIVDVTTEMLSQIAYVALGLAILSARAPRNSLVGSLTTVFVVGVVLAGAGGALFIALQRHGHRLTERLAARLLPKAVAATVAVGTALDTIYRSPTRVGLSSTLHLAGWVASAIGAWITFRLIGVQIDLAAVMAIESLVYATKSAGFIVPNALGVQEAAYAMLAPLFGVGAEFGLAVSLLKRARDIAVGVPTLLIWQALEGQRALNGDSGPDAIDSK